MKKITIIAALILGTNIVSGQYKIDTSFYSETLGIEKMVDIYFPPGYNEDTNMYYSVIYYLHGYGGNQNTMNEMITWLTTSINNGSVHPVIMVGADNSTPPFGGSAYQNSILWGNYEDYMVNDLISWIDNSFRTIQNRNGRGLLGQSMGGYGAFRYGVLHKDKFCVLASHAGTINFQDAYFKIQMQQAVKQENSPGPPYFYDFYNTGLRTKFYFIVYGAGVPDTATPQLYINPTIVQFPMDENGDYIDTVTVKANAADIPFLIQQLLPSDSVGILFGDGMNDEFYLYPGTLAIKDTLDLLGLPYEFYSHNGGHNMPGGFKQRSLTFIDSLLFPPIITGIDQLSIEIKQSTLSCYPNPFANFFTVAFDFVKDEFMVLEIYNHWGEKIETLYEGNIKAGRQQHHFDAIKLPAGMYFCRVQVGNERARAVVTKKIIKID